MVISGLKAMSGSAPDREPAEQNAPAQEPVTTLALVPVEPAERISTLRPVRPQASFVAHLIATAEHAPQTRALRRTTPAVARATYDHATTKGGIGQGRILSQIA